MDTFLLQAALALLVLAIFYQLSSRWGNRYKKQKITRQHEAPEPSGRWPIIGHLHLLGGKTQTLARTLSALADEYGPIFTLWLGQRRALVVSNWELAKECLTVQDKALATRPLLAAGKYMCYNYSMFALAPYGPFWREARKLATLHLLSARQLEQLKHVRATEVSLSIKRLHNLWVKNKKHVPVKVELKKWLGDLTFNNVVMLAAGKRYYGEDVTEDEDEAAKFKEAIVQFFYLTGIIVPSDAIPFLEWLDLGGYIRAMKKIQRDLDLIGSGWIQEHQRRRESGELRAHHDVIDVMLSMVESFPFADCDPLMTIKATALSLILAGTDTTYVTMTWALSLLLNNRQVLKKAQEELDNLVGKDRNVDESDIQNLSYLQAIVKETLRLYPPGPLSVPHEAIEDCSIGGFHIPAGTQVMFNLWKIHRDPTIWEDPSAFSPERFLTSHKDVDVKGQDCQLIPFGAGRRMCPGITFALQSMHLTLARLLHGFDMQTEGGKSVDMSEGLGLTMPKLTPLGVILTPRLAPHLYQLQ